MNIFIICIESHNLINVLDTSWTKKINYDFSSSCKIGYYNNLKKNIMTLILRTEKSR